MNEHKNKSSNSLSRWFNSLLAGLVKADPCSGSYVYAPAPVSRPGLIESLELLVIDPCPAHQLSSERC